MTVNSICDDFRWDMSVLCWCFFFSSRRRHTRLQGDWSSDVCSSDLMRLLSWLRQSELREAPELSGIWGEASVRMRRWLRQSVQQVQQGDQRLDRKSVV